MSPKLENIDYVPGTCPLIPKHGGYRNLKSFQVAQLVYDVTVRFCDRTINKRSRTHDQMMPASGSGELRVADAERFLAEAGV